MNFRNAFRICFLSLGMFLAASSFAQDNGGGGKDNGEQKAPTSRAERKKAKTEWKKQRKKEMSDAKAKKEYHKKYNTKKTRKRMKKTAKKAKMVNENKREFFVKRWLKKLKK
jgi:hypothetical protein